MRLLLLKGMNLFNDYTYDSANRLVSVTKGETISQYGYNGLGDLVLQTINGLTTNYVLDLNTGLTQVLQDGTNTYLYGINRIAQSTAKQSEFFLADVLGSVRNLSNPLAEITLTQSYTPFGEVLNTSGEGQMDYAFTGEMYDPNTGLVFLRAWYYSASDGHFTSRDAWDGDERMPMSYNAWLYVYANPITKIDPTGYYTTSSTGYSNDEETNNCTLEDDYQFCILSNGAFIDESHYGSGEKPHRTQSDFWDALRDSRGKGDKEVRLEQNSMGFLYIGYYPMNIPSTINGYSI